MGLTGRENKYKQEEGARKQGEENARGQPTQPHSQQQNKSQNQITEVGKGKSPEEKGRWDNSRKAG